MDGGLLIVVREEAKTELTADSHQSTSANISELHIIQPRLRRMTLYEQRARLAAASGIF